MSSCLLYHGPGAEKAAMADALSDGRLLAAPFGNSPNGLKVDEAREFVSLMTTVPVGDKTGTLVVGPMDVASPKSSDTLLKCLEEFSSHVRPILWAWDLGEVTSTVRSRCLDVWAPVVGPGLSDPLTEEVARDLITAHRTGSAWEVPVFLKKLSEKGATWPSRTACSALLAEVADALSTEGLKNASDRVLWAAVREALRHDPTVMETVVVFMPGAVP